MASTFKFKSLFVVVKNVYLAAGPDGVGIRMVFDFSVLAAVVICLG
jgi:hypothetical protein